MFISAKGARTAETYPDNGSVAWFWEPSLGLTESGFPPLVDGMELDASVFVGVTTTRPLVSEWQRGNVPLFDGSNDKLVWNGLLPNSAWTHEGQGAMLLFAFVPLSGGVDGYIFDSSRIAASRLGIGFLYDTSEYLRVRIANGDPVNYVSVDTSILNVTLDEPHVASVRFGTLDAPNMRCSLNGSTVNYEQFTYSLGAGNSYAYPTFGIIGGGGSYPWKGMLLGAFGSSSSVADKDARAVERWFRRRVLPSLWYRIDATNGCVVAIQGNSNHRIEISHDVVPASHKDVWRVTGDMYREHGKRTDFLSAWEIALPASGGWMGSSHGNEELTVTGASIQVFSGGNPLPVDLAVTSCAPCDTIILTQETELLDPTTSIPVATKTTVHTITATSMTISQTVVWSDVVTIGSTPYCAMFPRDHWGVSHITRGNGEEEALSDNDQALVYASNAMFLGKGTGIKERVRCTQSVAHPLPEATRAFVVGHATVDPYKRSKLYFQFAEAARDTSIGEVWEWSTKYFFDVSGSDTFALGAWAWDVYWDADNGLSGDTVSTWEPRISRNELYAEAGEEPEGGTFSDGRRVVQFNATNYDCLRANEFSEYCSGDDTTFTVAIQFATVGALVSGRRIWSTATTADATHYYTLRFGTSTVYPSGRDGGAEVSGSSGVTIAADTEYVLVFVRHGDTYDLYLDGGVAVPGTLTLGTLGVLDTFTIGDMIRSAVSSRYPSNIKVRRFAFVRGDSIGLAEAIAINEAWSGK